MSCNVVQVISNCPVDLENQIHICRHDIETNVTERILPYSLIVHPSV